MTIAIVSRVNDNGRLKGGSKAAPDDRAELVRLRGA